MTLDRHVWLCSLIRSSWWLAVTWLAFQAWNSKPVAFTSLLQFPRTISLMVIAMFFHILLIGSFSHLPYDSLTFQILSLPHGLLSSMLTPTLWVLCACFPLESLVGVVRISWSWGDFLAFHCFIHCFTTREVASDSPHTEDFCKVLFCNHGHTFSHIIFFIVCISMIWSVSIQSCFRDKLLHCPCIVLGNSPVKNF